MAARQGDLNIRTHPCPRCYICSNEGRMLYRGLNERLCDIQGEWDFKKCPDPECSLIWLDPMPLAEDTGKAYKNYYTHLDLRDNSVTWLRRVYQWIKEGYLARRYGYRSESLEVWKRFLGLLLYFHPGRRENVNFSVMYLPSLPSGRLLDVGCGSGEKIKFMRDMGWQAEGVDIDPVAVSSARAKGLQVRLGPLEGHNYPDNYFDAITMSHLIEHVYNPLGLLIECHRILKPGGRLVVITPNSDSWMHKIFKKSWLALDPPRHLHIFSLMSLQLLIKKAGFQKFRLSTTIREANRLFAASRSIQQTGKYQWGSPIPYHLRLRTRSMQLAEWAILKLKPDLGEEIVLVGVK